MACSHLRSDALTSHDGRSCNRLTSSLVTDIGSKAVHPRLYFNPDHAVGPLFGCRVGPAKRTTLVLHQGAGLFHFAGAHIPLRGRGALWKLTRSGGSDSNSPRSISPGETANLKEPGPLHGTRVARMPRPDQGQSYLAALSHLDQREATDPIDPNFGRFAALDRFQWAYLAVGLVDGCAAENAIDAGGKSLIKGVCRN